MKSLRKVFVFIRSTYSIKQFSPHIYKHAERGILPGKMQFNGKDKKYQEVAAGICLRVLKTSRVLLLLQYFEDVVSFDDMPLSPKVVTLCKHFLRMAQCFILFRKSSESAQKEW